MMAAPHGQYWIFDHSIQDAAAQLRNDPRTAVVLRFDSDRPDISELLPALNGHDLVRLYLENHFRHPGGTASSHILRQVPREKLEMFRGYLGAADLTLLPPSLEYLHLVVADDDKARTLLPVLKSIKSKLPSLLALSMHVPVSAVTPGSLTSLPGDTGVWVYLSGVGEKQVEAAVRVIATLCPKGKNGYEGLTFPSIALDVKGWQRLLQGMKDKGVKVYGRVKLPQEARTYEGLETLVNTSLGCKTIDWVDERGMYGWC